MSEETKVVTKKLNKKLVFTAIAVIAVVLIAVLGTVASKSAGAKKLEEQLSLGEKYLSELNYEQAIACYLAAIEIDPKNADAYLGLADTYIAQGEYENAMEVLENALNELTGDAAEAVREKLEEMKGHFVSNVPQAESSIPLEQQVAAGSEALQPEKNTETMGTFKWKVKEDGTVVIAELLDKSLMKVEVPAEIEGKVVTEIGEYAFNNCENVQAILLPESIVSIGKGAFLHCHELQEMILPTGITEIKHETFRCCYGLTNVVLPDGITIIGEQAFTFCESMESIMLPDSVIVIEDDAFSFCKSLKEISLSNKLEQIGEMAFYECDNLQSISMPDSLTTLGYCAFYECSNLEEITLSENLVQVSDSVFSLTKWLSLNLEAEEMAIVNGFLFRGVNKESIVIPEGVTRIEVDAFANCSNVKYVSFPDSLERIDAFAFSGTEWSKQSNLIIAGKVLYEAGYSIYGDVIVPEGIISISDYVFAMDFSERIDSVYIPASVTEIGESAFIDSPHIIIITPSGSYAEQYAKEHGISYKIQ